MKRILGFFLLAVVVGCGSEDKPLPFANVSGTVTFNDQPIVKGEITFASEGRPPATMVITDGKFSGSAMVGPNKVSVSAKKKGTSTVRMDAGAKAQVKGYMERMSKKEMGSFGSPPADYDPDMVEYIPPSWGQASTNSRVVEPGKPNEFKIEIKGDGKGK